MKKEILYLKLATVGRYQDKYILTFLKINALFIYDLKSKEFFYIDSFQAEREKQCMYTRSFTYKDEIWFLPAEAKKISILNMRKMQIEYISIYSDKEDYIPGNKYINFMKLNNQYVCLVPRCMRQAVIINMETKKVEKYYKISKQNEEFQSVVLIGNTLCFYPWNGNRKVTLNLLTEEFIYEEWDGNEKYGDAVYDKITGNIFHAPAKEDHVLIEDIQGSLVNKVSIFHSNSIVCNTFYSSFYKGEILFWGSNGVISINSKENKICYSEIRKDKDKGILVPIDSTTKEAFVFGGNHIFQYNDVQKEYKAIEISISFKKLATQIQESGKKFYDLYKYREHDFEMENDPLSLNTFIYLVKHNLFNDI